MVLRVVTEMRGERGEKGERGERGKRLWLLLPQYSYPTTATTPQTERGRRRSYYFFPA